MGKFFRKTKEERCDEIRKAGIKAFLEKGYKSTTMEDVISYTTLSKGGVYRYYSSTRDIMIDIMKAGNEYRMSILKEQKINFDKDVDMKTLLISFFDSKLFSKNIYTKLYVMFMSEMVYDEEMRNLFYKLEDDSYLEFESLIRYKVSKDELKKFKENWKFIVRFLNGIVFVGKVFEEDDIFFENRDKLNEIIAQIF